MLIHSKIFAPPNLLSGARAHARVPGIRCVNRCFSTHFLSRKATGFSCSKDDQFSVKNREKSFWTPDGPRLPRNAQGIAKKMSQNGPLCAMEGWRFDIKAPKDVPFQKTQKMHRRQRQALLRGPGHPKVRDFSLPKLEGGRFDPSENWGPSRSTSSVSSNSLIVHGILADLTFSRSLVLAGPNVWPFFARNCPSERVWGRNF